MTCWDTAIEGGHNMETYRRDCRIPRALLSWMLFLFLTLSVCGVAYTLTSSPSPALRERGAIPNGGWGAQWSPDGKRIAFFSQRVGEPENLYVMSAEGRNPRQLTTRGVRTFRWSPNSELLYALTWYGAGSGARPYWCRIALKDGGVQKTWTWLPQEAVDPTPSPDGVYLAYLLPTAKSQDLWIARADSTQRQKIIGDFLVQRPMWSPDGKQIAFEIASPHQSWQTQVWIYHLEKKRLAHMKGLGTALHAWSADSKRLAFSVAMPPRAYLLGTCDVETGEGKPAKKIIHTGEGVAWSPDGQMLAVTMRQSSGSQIALVRPNGTVVKRIGDAKLLARFPQWSPDGKWILFEGQEKNKSFTSEVWIAETDGDKVERLTPSSPADWSPCPSPDGQRVAFLSTRNCRCEVWLCDASGSNAKPIAEAEPDSRLVWSPDGKRLLVLKRSGSVLLRVNGHPDKSAPPSTINHQPLNIKPMLPFASWSPDGKKFLFTGVGSQRAALMVYDLATNSAKPLTLQVKATPKPKTQNLKPERTPSDFYGTWDAKGRYLAFIRGKELWLANADGKDARRWATLVSKDDVEVSDLRWSPRGDQVLVCLMRATATSEFFEIRTVSVSGKARTVVSEPLRSDFAAQRSAYTCPPAWTPSGDIVFTSDRTGVTQVWRVNPSDGKAKPLVPRGATYPALLPNGRVLFVTPNGSRTTIWSADLKAGTATVWVKA